MPSTILGLPLHPLVVHATATIVPLAVLVVLLAVLWPRFRGWAGLLPAGLSLVALVLTPLSTATGENLEHTLPENALIEKHAELGDQLLPFTIALFVFAAAFWWLDRRRTAELAAGTDAAAGPDDRDLPAGGMGGHGGGTATATRPETSTGMLTGSRLRTITLVVGALAVLASVGTGVQVARIGHSGAEAAWSQTGAGSGSGSGS